MDPIRNFNSLRNYYISSQEANTNKPAVDKKSLLANIYLTK